MKYPLQPHPAFGEHFEKFRLEKRPMKLKVKLNPGVVVEKVVKIACECAMCRKKYEEEDWIHEPLIVQICAECLWAQDPARGNGIRWGDRYMWDYDFLTHDNDARLLRKRAYTLGVALAYLEKELKRCKN